MTTILIVDDNPLFQQQAAQLCREEGFDTLTAGTWTELNMVLSQSTPDLVLMDIELPTIPGHRLGAFVRARHRIPVVLVSALAEEKLRRLFAVSDADAWICKPLTREKLIAAVTRFIRPHRSPSDTGETEKGMTATRHTLLLVEDDPVIVDRIEQVLRDTCDITIARDGEQAIEHLWTGAFDRILLDLMLPRLSGFDVVRHLMMHRPDLLKSTYIMTAATDASLQFIDPSAVAGILRKPFEINTLPELMNRTER